MHLPELNRRALHQTGTFVAAVQPERLDLPTPCAGWTLADLLRHMVANNHGWAAAARGAPAERATWEQATLGADPYRAYQESVVLVDEAFSDPAASARSFDVYGYGTFRAPAAYRMHFVDYLVHGWDVAATLGITDGFADELSEAALQIALRWPYQRPDKAFGVKVEVPADAPAHHRLVGYLGRSPAWPADPR